MKVSSSLSAHELAILTPWSVVTDTRESIKEVRIYHTDISVAVLSLQKCKETEGKCSRLHAICSAGLSLLILMQEIWLCNPYYCCIFLIIKNENSMQENQQQHFSQVTFIPKNKSIQSITVWAFVFVAELQEREETVIIIYLSIIYHLFVFMWLANHV